ncbi:MAG: phosphotransferase [Actinobacteria bacterium]|nr:phosphotransferase [Actinomycetota bacterium]
MVRRYRVPADTAREAEIMRHAAAFGFPVPEVYEVTPAEMVMTRLHGPTMREAMVADPSSIGTHTTTLIELHHRLAEIPGPAWLTAVIEPGVALVHLDLHPGNVVLTDEGPVVIDWTDAGRGPIGADPALVWLLTQVVDVEATGGSRPLSRETLTRFADLFLTGFDKGLLAPLVTQLAEMRLADPHMSDSERSRIRRLLEAGPVTR